MHREIKFRAWDGYKMHYGISIDGCGRPISDILETKNHIVMQYSGLKDKNGVEIYEGDVIKVERWTSPININTGLPQETSKNFFVKWSNIEYPDDYPSYSVSKFILTIHGTDIDLEDSEELQVIGNIYENPELLGVE